MGSETGYERLALSQTSTTSTVTTGRRTKRKCSLAINPIHQVVTSKRLRVEQDVQKHRRE